MWVSSTGLPPQHPQLYISYWLLFCMSIIYLYSSIMLHRSVCVRERRGVTFLPAIHQSTNGSISRASEASNEKCVLFSANMHDNKLLNHS